MQSMEESFFPRYYPLSSDNAVIDVTAYGSDGNRRKHSERYCLPFKSDLAHRVNTSDWTSSVSTIYKTLSLLQHSNAVAFLLETESQLADHMTGTTPLLSTLANEAMGVRAYYENRTFDIAHYGPEDESAIDWIGHRNMMGAFKAEIVECVRNMVRESKYSQAIQFEPQGPYSETKPRVLIGGCPLIVTMLRYEFMADDYILGMPIEFSGTYDARLERKVYITLQRHEGNQPEPDCLSFGFMGNGTLSWKSLFSYDVEKQTNVCTAHVVPQYRHVCCLPVLACFTMKGLDEYASTVPDRILSEDRPTPDAR